MPAPRRVLARLGDGMLRRLQAAVPEVEFVTRPAESDVLVSMNFDRPGLVGILGPDVRWVHLMGTGVDGFPFDALGSRVLTCSRGAPAPAIAEFVLAVMLAFEKRLPDAWIDAPPEHWNFARLGTLRGRTLGLVGFGSIAREVARRALPFDMRVVAVRRTPQPPDIDGVEPASSLHEMLAASDHVVVTAPATPDTHHLLDASAFAAIKPGAHLVNISRGSLVDQDALIAALDDGRVAIASLDVMDPEPLPAGHALYRHPKVRVSPHISWSAPETMERTVAIFVENLRRYDAGEPLLHVVDPATGY